MRKDRLNDPALGSHSSVGTPLRCFTINSPIALNFVWSLKRSSLCSQATLSKGMRVRILTRINGNGRKLWCVYGFEESWGDSCESAKARGWNKVSTTNKHLCHSSHLVRSSYAYFSAILYEMWGFCVFELWCVEWTKTVGSYKLKSHPIYIFSWFNSDFDATNNATE